MIYKISTKIQLYTTKTLQAAPIAQSIAGEADLLVDMAGETMVSEWKAKKRTKIQIYLALSYVHRPPPPLALALPPPMI